jgi:hypothetical protein
MAKKYSVNVENDEVISIEVDGVQYESPDDIPVEADRNKILNLIEKTTGDDFGEDFDKEFEAEVSQMQRQSAGAPKIIVSIFAAVGALMLVIALISMVSTVRSLAREASAPGLVVDMTLRQSYDSETRVTSEYYYPVVQFDLNDGTPKRVQLSEGSWPPEYEVGQPVTVLYDPEKPLDARIKSASSTFLKWILPGVTGVVGVVFLGFTYLINRFLLSDTNE